MPVVCCGSAVAGGSGKTPVSRFIAKSLKSRGYQPVVVLRGYGGKLSGPLRVEKEHDPSQVGDEALEHYKAFDRDIPVVIASSRVEGAAYIEKEKLGNIIVLDDGYQHRALDRDINLLLVNDLEVDGANLHYNDYLIPAGRLRESVSDALKRASAVIRVVRPSHRPINSCSLIKRKGANSVPCFSICLSPVCFVDIVSGEEYQLDQFAGRNVIAMSAIAKNELFVQTLYNLELKVISKHLFPDHWSIGLCEINAAFAEFEEIQTERAPIICTEKDAVKLREAGIDPGVVFALKIEADLIDSGAEEKFWKFMSVV